MNNLIVSLMPELQQGEFVFCTVADAELLDFKDAICIFREKEGLSLILPWEIADKRHISYSYIASWITITVYSSLESVGLTAAISKALTEAAISSNIVAGFHHDHVFVARKDTERAMRTLARRKAKYKG